jgi:hypothetical protein
MSVVVIPRPAARPAVGSDTVCRDVGPAVVGCDVPRQRAPADEGSPRFSSLSSVVVTRFDVIARYDPAAQARSALGL